MAVCRIASHCSYPIHPLVLLLPINSLHIPSSSLSPLFHLIVQNILRHHGFWTQCSRQLPSSSALSWEQLFSPSIANSNSPTGSKAALLRHRRQGLPPRKWHRAVINAIRAADVVAADGADFFGLRRPGKHWKREWKRGAGLLPPPASAARARSSHASDDANLPPTSQQLPDSTVGSRPRQWRIHAPRIPRRRQQAQRPRGCRYL